MSSPQGIMIPAGIGWDQFAKAVAVVHHPDDPRRAYVERVIGRELRPAERAIDVIRLDRALNRAKNDLEHAIHDEMLRAAKRWIRGGMFWRPHLQMTGAMRQPMRELKRLGREEAQRELARIGARAHAAFDPDPRVPGLDEVFDTIAAGLPGLSWRIEKDLVTADLTDASTAAIARALLAVPGARDIASRVVSAALMAGFSGVFEDADDVVSGWEYTAVLDQAVCLNCAPLDGSQYPTWAAIQQVLPNGGPNPTCLGGGRCRCRAVPVG